MKLNPVPFDMIKDGRKTCEARLYDEKRQKIDLGDRIVFNRLDGNTETLEVVVVGLLRYGTFGDMFAHVGAERFGGKTAEGLADAMLSYYSQQEQDDHGVLGIDMAIVR